MNVPYRAAKAVKWKSEDFEEILNPRPTRTLFTYITVRRHLISLLEQYVFIIIDFPLKTIMCPGVAQLSCPSHITDARWCSVYINSFLSRCSSACAEMQTADDVSFPLESSGLFDELESGTFVGSTTTGEFALNRFPWSAGYGWGSRLSMLEHGMQKAVTECWSIRKHPWSERQSESDLHWSSNEIQKHWLLLQLSRFPLLFNWKQSIGNLQALKIISDVQVCK